MDFKERYFGIWKDAWQFHKEFSGMAGTDGDWERAVGKAGEIVSRYKGKPEHGLVKGLVLAALEELERVDKDARREEDGALGEDA